MRCPEQIRQFRVSSRNLRSLLRRLWTVKAWDARCIESRCIYVGIAVDCSRPFGALEALMSDKEKYASETGNLRDVLAFDSHNDRAVVTQDKETGEFRERSVSSSHRLGDDIKEGNKK